MEKGGVKARGRSGVVRRSGSARVPRTLSRLRDQLQPLGGGPDLVVRVVKSGQGQEALVPATQDRA
jgi:hypothetical protein